MSTEALKLDDIEQYRMQMAGISTAAIGYWKEGDPIHPDYDTLALRDVAKLYAKYAALAAAPAGGAEPVALTDAALEKCERVAKESGAWESYKAVGEAFAELRSAIKAQGGSQ